MEIIDNITHLLGDNLKKSVTPGAKLKIAASCFSIYAFEALKAELEQIESLEFIFTSPTFVPAEVTDKMRKERREFHIPKAERERNFFGTEFEIRLKNELTQRAIAKECAEWMRRKAKFRSNRGKAPMQQFACVKGTPENAVYQENSPERIYFLILYNIFNEFLEENDEWRKGSISEGPMALDCGSLLPLSAMQPAASGASGGYRAFPVPMPSDSQQGCIAQSYSRL